MKFAGPKLTTEIVPNLAWIKGQKAIISLYSLREIVDQDCFSCDFEQAVNIVEEIHRNWNIEHWCFDWSAERDLEVYDDSVAVSIFTAIEQHLLKPLATVFSNASVSFIHGDADINQHYVNWCTKNKPEFYLQHVTHINRFFYDYNQQYPSARPHRLIHTSFTSFNRKHTVYRERLYDYLKNKDLLHKGYVNFAFNSFSTLVKSLPEEYEGNKWASESELYNYYRAANFDVIIETSSNGENQRFITEKTLRALALGQPFIVYNGPGTLKYLQGLGFETYKALWDESYDAIDDPQKRFEAVVNLIPKLVKNTAVFENPLVKEIADHNQLLFQRLAEIDHREHWLRNKLA